MRQIIVIAHNLRSCHNVGSLLRTAEGLGIKKTYLTGYTPYPKRPQDDRLPHIAEKLHKQISKTALGAEVLDIWERCEDIFEVIKTLKSQGFVVAALEQSEDSIMLSTWEPADKVAIILGRETLGLERDVMNFCDQILEIPMYGKKESFNVVQAAAMALYHGRFM